MLTVDQFINAYTGWAKDVDGAAGIQCVDLAKEHFRLAGVPDWSTAIGGDGYSDQIWYNRSRWAKWYSLIDKSQGFQNGDMVLFPHAARGGWTHPDSHVCFYYNGQEFGTNQGKKPACLKNTDWSDALGALRWKMWEGEELPYGYSKLIRNKITAMVYRGNRAAGYSLHVLSADGETALYDITKFDTDKVRKAAVVNGGYFQFKNDQPDPYGRHYGVEQDAAAGNSYTQAPKQSGILAYYEDHDGNCEYMTADQYFGSPEDVNFAITPYAVRIHKGQKVFGRSVNYGDKDDEPNTQTAAVKFDNGDWAVAVFPDKICPRDTVTFFDAFRGVEELILMDSGGSTQMLAWNNSTMSMEKKLYTERKLPNVLVIAQIIDGPDTPAEIIQEPEDVPIVVPEPIEIPEEDESMSEQVVTVPEVTPEQQQPTPAAAAPAGENYDVQTITGAIVKVISKIADLIDVKSIMTVMVIYTLCYLTINLIPIDEKFFQIAQYITIFYFGYQVGKAAVKK